MAGRRALITGDGLNFVFESGTRDDVDSSQARTFQLGSQSALTLNPNNA